MKTISSPELTGLLLSEGVYHCSPVPPSDKTYALPHSTWFQHVFAAWFAEVEEKLGVLPYKAESNDCDDFADRFVVFAKICHANTEGTMGTSLAVSAFWYVSPRGPHAIVAAITSDRGLIFMEPQDSASEVKVTVRERDDAIFLRF